jgi:urease subunit beta
MRPGEVLPGEGPVPQAIVTRSTTVRIRNQGRFPASLSSHFPLEWASREFVFPRDECRGGRLHLPAGASVRIEAGAEIEVDVVWT